jgi:YidC/Oxa1 family membrane protein insertase
MVRPQDGDTVVANGVDRKAGKYRLGVRFGTQSVIHACTVYAGPIEYSSLKICDPQLTRLMFAMLWNWMRWLSLGLLFIYDWLVQCIPSIGAGILLLSVCVKVLMIPLILVAEQWQKDVNVTKSRLQPILDDIKRSYRGEEQNRRTLAAYREQGVSPFYTVKSLFGALIQIPVFFAAYHMLSENIALNGVSFLWINDLSMQDSLFTLPFALPFFGRNFNLLPFCMTGVTLLTSWLFADRSLSEPLRRRQRYNLYWMAGVFFVLFYTFPAGMVLYWTMNNLLAFAKTMFDRQRIKAA